GFLLSTGSEVGEGSTDGQSVGPFTTASLAGAFFLVSTDPPEQNVSDVSSIATFDGLGTVSGTSDSASLASAPSSNAFSQSYSGLPEGMSFDRSMVRSLFPTGEFRAMNRMHSQNPLRSPGAWQAYR